MTIKWILLLVLSICAGGLLITLLVLSMLRHRGGGSTSQSGVIFAPSGKGFKGLGSILLQSYRLGMKVPLLSAYILQVQKRISFRHVGDEPSLRRLTMTVVLIILGGYGGISVILFLLQPGIAFVILSVLCAVVLNSLVLDMCLSRMEKGCWCRCWISLQM